MTPEIHKRIEQIRRGEVPDGYKKTKVGIVPAEWTVCNMGEIYSERKEAGNPTLPILTVSIHSGVSNGELDESELGKKVKRIEDKTQYLTVRKGDLVFNMMRAWQGAIGVVQVDGLVSPAYIVAKPTVKVCSAFMDEYIKLPESINRLRKKSYGVTDFRLRLYWDSFVKVDCCIPTLAEQDKIAEILTAQDRVIELCEKKVEQLKKLKKVFLQKMFPKPGATVPEWRFPGFTDAWEQRKLGDCCYQMTATLNPPETPDKIFVEYSMPAFDNGEKADVVLGNTMNSARKILDRPCLLINKLNVRKKRIWIVKMPENNAVASAEFVPVYSDDVDLTFLKYMVSSDSFTSYLEDCSSGSSNSQKRVTPDVIMSAMLVMPSMAEQIKIGNYLEGIENFITLHQNKCDEEKQKKKVLMQLLLTGIVRVK